MSTTNYQQVTEGLRILTEVLAYCVARELRAKFGEGWWSRGVLGVLRQEQRRDLPAAGADSELITKLDAARCLHLMDAQWHDPFRRKLSGEHRFWIKELIRARNKWAHAGPLDMVDEDAWRALDTMIRLVEPLDAEAAERLRVLARTVRYRTAVSSVSSVPVPAAGGGTVPERPAPPPVDGGRSCPVTGRPVSAGRTFAGLGSDAKAKSAINALLAGAEDRAEKLMAGFVHPERVREAAGRAAAEGLDHIERPSPWFRRRSPARTAAAEGGGENRVPTSRQAVARGLERTGGSPGASPRSAAGSSIAADKDQGGGRQSGRQDHGRQDHGDSDEHLAAYVTPSAVGSPGVTRRDSMELMELTAAQRRAVEHAGRNLQLVACAGSGKTEVVARRVAHLLAPDGDDALEPRNIVAFTFTEKAAAELKERIVTRTREALGEIHGMADLFVGTIHAFCLDLLQGEAPEYLKYEVLNEVQQAIFVDRNCRLAGLTTSKGLNGVQLKRYVDTNHYVNALAILREADLEPSELNGCSVVAGLDAYRELLRERSYFDYSSILEVAAESLTNHTDLRRRLAERLRYVIVDEYQDVNPIQEKIVRSLHDLGARVCVVGDDDQTIYQWRGSDVRNILAFRDRYPGVDRIRLDENFRSSAGIVDTARVFIEQNAKRLQKAMTPAGEQVTERGDVVALAFDAPEEEAEHIAATARSLRGVAFRDGEGERGLAWSDMAVLLRSVKRNAESILAALDAAKIPYVVTGMADLFGAKEADAARQLFYFMADRDGVDKAAVRQAWQRADLGLKPRDLERAVEKAAEVKTAIRETGEQNAQRRWSTYSIQRVFLKFLEDVGVREEQVPDGRGEVVFFNLGKFSQVITDYETIHYRSKPADKYQAFANFLVYRAEDTYPEGWQDNQYANPDAVRIMTVHQAKGMEWPVVFLPALLRNRFPAPRVGGKGVWHLIPDAAVEGAERFRGTTEDERRLFYVAMTRSRKFLHMTWAPVPGKNNRYACASGFWDDVLVSKHVRRRRPDYAARPRTTPKPRAGVANVVFSFSNLKHFFDCPYDFKLRVLYGFDTPVHEALGYGKSLHDALAEVHARAVDGRSADAADPRQLVETHLRVPYAYPALREKLEVAAERVLRDYLDDNAAEFDNIEFSEKQVEISLGDGVTVNGRIDLVRRLDTDETTIVDLKSSERAQAEKVTEAQLDVYALGYQELTGRNPDYVEIYELEQRKRKPRSVDEDLIADVKAKTRDAARALRTGDLRAEPSPRKCQRCDYRGMCTDGSQAVQVDASRRRG